MAKKVLSKQKKEQLATLSSMSREKILEMKQQAALKSKMQVAFQTGDLKTFHRLKERLAADE
jgi:hypothetical protein